MLLAADEDTSDCPEKYLASGVLTQLGGWLPSPLRLDLKTY
jgi:hypothetical protein